MLTDGSWEIPAMMQQNGLKRGTPTPQVFASKAGWGSGRVLAIPKGGKHQKQTETFVDWIIQHSSKWARSGTIPAMNSAWDSTLFKSPQGARDLPNRCSMR